MTERRFTDKPDLDPTAVRSLPSGHPALMENRTLFPSTVVDVDENFDERLLVSGRNNRKLGETIIKGKFKGYALYQLSLEERATCPVECEIRGACYGNGMQLARRHRIGDQDFFATCLEDEIREILDAEPAGLMVRLHVLGDFPSVEYVNMWSGLLDDYSKLACFGYTHRKPKDKGGDAIGAAIVAAKIRHPERFRIRWSGATSQPDGATVINRVPTTSRVPEGLVCPAQTDATACCASCGLCWEEASKKESIVFIKHGPKSIEAAAQAARPAEVDAGDTRKIAAIALPAQMKPAPLTAPTPELEMVDPRSLLVEPSYQRDLSGRSIKLIRKIVTGWDWSKFKPPVCARTPEGLFVMDGQHTAIAAATHPSIKEIPILVAGAKQVEQRAAAFVSHNRDRLTMTPAQIFYAAVTSGDKKAQATFDAIRRAGGTIPRSQVPKSAALPGQISAIAELRSMDPALAERIVLIAVKSKIAPVAAVVIRGLRAILTDKPFVAVAKMSDEQIAAALASLDGLLARAFAYAAESGQDRYRACAVLIAKAALFDRKDAA